MGIEEDYFFELMDLLAELEGDLLSLDHGFDDTKASSINRCFHSLKGNSGMLGLMALETLFHRSESEFIAQAKTETIEIDTFLKVVDATKDYFSNPSEKTVKDCLNLFDLKSEISQQPPRDKVEEIESVYLNVFHLDDEKDILVSTKIQLENYGCKVFSFTEIDHMKNTILDGNIPDLFIIDYYMPTQNGNSVINGLNSILPNIPKMILTGMADQKIMFESINRGIIGFLEKPIDSFYLEKILKKAAKIKAQNEINKKTYEIAIQYESLSQDQVRKKLEEIKDLINSTLKK